MLASLEYVKTLLNGAIAYIRKEIKDNTPNWEENDPDANGYIENRPFYTEKSKTVITDLGNTFDDWLSIVGDDYNNASISTLTLSFRIDGVIYQNVVPKHISDGGGWAYYMEWVNKPNEWQGGHYEYSIYFGGGNAYGPKDVQWSIVKVTTINEVVHKIPEKYYDVPTKTSQLTNDSGYLTEHQSLENYALKSEIPTIPTGLKNPNILTIKIGDQTYTYDGSEAITIEIPTANGGE